MLRARIASLAATHPHICLREGGSVTIHPISFLLGLGAAVALPALARVIRPVVVEVAAAGMAVYDETVRIAAEQLESIEDIAAEVRARREAALAAAGAAAQVATE
jgi:hypothetical protein